MSWASETKHLKESLATAQNNFQISQKKLEFTKNATEQKLIDSITNTEGYRADNILIGVYSATLDEDEIDFETDIDDSKDCRSRKDVFNSMKKKLNLDNPQQNERFKEVTNMILEKVKHTKNQRNQWDSIKVFSV